MEVKYENHEVISFRSVTVLNVKEHLNQDLPSPLSLRGWKNEKLF